VGFCCGGCYASVSGTLVYARVAVRKYFSSKGRAAAPGMAGLQLDFFSSTRHSSGLNRTKGAAREQGKDAAGKP